MEERGSEREVGDVGKRVEGGGGRSKAGREEVMGMFPGGPRKRRQQQYHSNNQWWLPSSNASKGYRSAKNVEFCGGGAAAALTLNQIPGQDTPGFSRLSLISPFSGHS